MNLQQIIKKATELHVANINNTDVYPLDEIYSTQLELEENQWKEQVMFSDN